MLKNILFTIGIILLAINIYGFFRTMRNPALYDEEKTLRNRANDVIIKFPEIKEQVKIKPGESRKDFAIRINTVVNKSMAHYWKDEGLTKYHLRVPIWENYLLYMASFISPKEYSKYEFSRYEKNLERGVGLCSTHSIVVKGLLNENGIEAELLDVSGRHVVLTSKIDDTTNLILDPDYGIAIPYDTTAILKNPEIVREAYKNMAALYYPDAKDPYTTDFIVKIFQGPLKTYSVNNKFEYFSYWAIWIIPFLLGLPYLLSLFRSRKTKII